ncbi:ABC-2 type transport system ATP-binding protein [Amycolatopsis xylanica]|uniref:ABC-2 type transport system ATP-binding protein n=1 Tax=Amycolatopsis xylanica TaxID=589385 RepID=A0A1H3NKT0_9PSEU|nr:ATP-binding cassette domain-containing protein [Amycolatopsis xylanica]SDY89045.1 ABC-2 type transport system ATP-binding protein [Amycolatopsis xylanica]
MQISLDDLGFAYGRKTALHEVKWVIDAGVTGLLGPNGAGKTTLLSVLIGLLRPKSGTVTIRDAEGGAVVSPRFGFVPQRFSLAGEMRVADTVSYTAWINGVPRRECAAAAEQALRAVALADKADVRVRSLSGGQRQRLGLAAGIAHDPEVLVLDEPTAGLDPGQRLRVREVIDGIGRTRTVLLSTHLLEDVEHLCQRVGVLVNGRIVFTGTVEELAAVMDEGSARAGLGSRFERGYDTLIDTLGDFE